MLTVITLAEVAPVNISTINLPLLVSFHLYPLEGSHYAQPIKRKENVHILFEIFLHEILDFNCLFIQARVISM